MNARIKKLLRNGEGLTVEFKRCHDKISHTVYETVCSFSNRYGGDMLLGVEDDGTVTGVAPAAVKQLKKDFANALNNPQIFNPTLLTKLMPGVRARIKTVREDHPWLEMPDMEILKSASLYQTTRYPETTGFTLAAILLFGREEVIRSTLPGYVTDCLLRRDDLDRYDDRLRVSCNLIEAFNGIMEFIAKHTLDRFYIEGVQSVSPRTKIARELVSNILSHREFTSTFPAKVIIERDRMVTENWCLPKLPGKLDPETFTPQPKNPLIANFFVNIGYADSLGSGVRNLYKYTKIYTNGGEPELIEGDIFRTIVPLSLIDMSDKMSDKTSDNAKMSDKMSDKTTRDKLLSYLRGNGEITAVEAARIIDRSAQTARRLLSELVADGVVIATGANRNRKYREKTCV